MFDQKQADAYRSLEAPAELRRRVLNMAAEKTERKPLFQTAGFRSLSAAAACLVLVLAVTLLNPVPAGPEFSVDGTPVTANAVTLPQSTQIATLSGARDLTLVSVPLTLEVSEETLLTVADGTLTAADPKTEEILFAGISGTVQKNVLLTWNISDESCTESSLIAKTADSVCTITLTFDADTHSWLIRCSVE